MHKKTIKDINIDGKKVFLRVDFNVPIKDGKVIDDTKIKAALPTINYLLEKKCALIIASHRGRPKGQVKEELRLNEAAAVLSELLGHKVIKIDTVSGDKVREAAARLKPGEILFLENVRFYPGEEKNDPQLAKEFGSLADIFVNDAFATAHRAHASTVGIASFLPSVGGFLMERELKYLEGALTDPRRPLAAVLGGAKVADKIELVRNMIKKVDSLLIGGGIACTFLKARGFPMGKSLVEEDKLPLAKELMEEAEKQGVPLILPVDLVAARELKEGQASVTVAPGELPEEFMALDIGPRTVAEFGKHLGGAGTVIWNGPLGAFEVPPFQAGTAGVARLLSEGKAISIIGGGDLVAAVTQAGLAAKMTHISTGGGATLEYLEGKELPGVKILAEK